MFTLCFLLVLFDPISRTSFSVTVYPLSARNERNRNKKNEESIPDLFLGTKNVLISGTKNYHQTTSITTGSTGGHQQSSFELLLLHDRKAADLSFDDHRPGKNTKTTRSETFDHYPITTIWIPLKGNVLFYCICDMPLSLYICCRFRCCSMRQGIVKSNQDLL